MAVGAIARSSHTTTLLPNGQVLVAAGDSAQGVLRSAELYNAATGTWTATGDLIIPRTEHTAALLPNGQVLVVGGFGGRSAEQYDPATGTWAATNSLKPARSHQTETLLLNGRCLSQEETPHTA